MRFRKERKIGGVALAAALLALLLGVAPARAAAHSAGSPARASLVDWAWNWVSSLWETVDEGWHIDPNGLAAPGPAAPPRETSDNGWHIDPNGLAVPEPAASPRETLENSMLIDPNG